MQSQATQLMGPYLSMSSTETQRSYDNLFHHHSVTDLGMSPGFQSLSLVQVADGLCINLRKLVCQNL